MDLIQILKNTPLFSDIADEKLHKVAGISRTHHYAKGDHLFHEGDTGTEFFIVMNGSVAINKNVAGGRKRNLSNLTSDEVFGELALFDSEPRSADAEAIEESEVIVIQNEAFIELLNKDLELANSIQQKIIRLLCKRLRNTDEMLSEGVIWGFKMEE